MFSKAFLSAWFILFCGFTVTLYAQTPPAASVNGKYSNLLQVLNCPTDRAEYGNYRDYGYWKGGAWCGQNGREGFWVWVHPNWYVWGKQGQAAQPQQQRPQIPAAASVNGKYTGLLQTLNCPTDRAEYGNYRDYGYWKGGAWCGQTGKAGHWVWVYPNWYVWQGLAQ